MSSDLNPSCDIFCAVIDNLGDAGVCWRLARQLAREHGWRVRLWIDDPSPLEKLAPDRQTIPVEVQRWQGDLPAIQPANVVIEAFACELPAAYLAAMAARPRPPVWLNLEYLSAEEWVAGCHALPSPHPRLPLTKYFFFPGFVHGTGGLLRERDFATHCAAPRAGHFVPPVPKNGFHEVTSTLGEALEISLFCYNNPALPALLKTWRDGKELVRCRVADGLPRQQVEDWLGESFPTGCQHLRGALELHAQPFLPQDGYDQLLAASQLNFVRGEDSLVRAQWVERPFVWQAYRQVNGAHHAKLDALLDRYCSALEAGTAAATRAFWRAWNGQGEIASGWPAFRAALPALKAHAPSWARQITAHGDLATNLVKFCQSKL
ncbi:MAG: elongation factor P maturation arginine rhamnosyltransferase EarP [Gammaproteobacteria bacterium]|nr:elongation factor P maturation arginine rhamnosyltransferase EarP [Rhodocyclaceae bacterium]MBU3907898.1 elongation factor P maturation arginine rhamnosyltransferase EarP [Gammaproteobacteria bacterium]MBU3988258.1 elongation factor P maturation arginine rhamnosyltransferase EarP [Gammaproteobacteria bacterium]MBU4003804.1 elongation factor P maturation arginine rhamnosyltransferase EarP [Gammaproteobacteria bacterium]MBU4021682.1 elongation factor P maturation arginine rhamnosyltransferase 